MTPELHAELTAWLDWAENGAPDEGRFNRWHGLCRNVSKHLRRELEAILPGNSSFPFDRDNYWRRYSNGTQHLDPARLAWVREQLGRKAP